jgi:hypothetical protein
VSGDGNVYWDGELEGNIELLARLHYIAKHGSEALPSRF